MTPAAALINMIRADATFRAQVVRELQLIAGISEVPSDNVVRVGTWRADYVLALLSAHTQAQYTVRRANLDLPSIAVVQLRTCTAALVPACLFSMNSTFGWTRNRLLTDRPGGAPCQLRFWRDRVGSLESYGRSFYQGALELEGGRGTVACALVGALAEDEQPEGAFNYNHWGITASRGAPWYFSSHQWGRLARARVVQPLRSYGSAEDDPHVALTLAVNSALDIVAANMRRINLPTDRAGWSSSRQIEGITTFLRRWRGHEPTDGQAAVVTARVNALLENNS